MGSQIQEYLLQAHGIIDQRVGVSRATSNMASMDLPRIPAETAQL
jgi:hypothetical protein